MKLIGLISLGDFLNHLTEYRNIGLTEAINRLLGIANNEEPIVIKRLLRVWPTANEVRKDFPLQSAGILKFINLDKAIPFLKVQNNRRRSLKNPKNPASDGIKVISVFLQAECPVFLIDLRKDKHQMIACQRCLFF